MTATALDSCDWAAPGADRYTGTATAAIHAFAAIPEPVRQRLVAKHDKRTYDDIVYIDRDTIRGRKDAWDPAIRNMHFGSRGKLCGQVDRSMWKSAQVESAVVYCDSGYCVAWPSVCGNWFVIAPLAERRAALAATETPTGPGAADGSEPALGAAASVPPLFDGDEADGSAVALLGDSATFGESTESRAANGGGGGGGITGGGSGGGGGGGGAPTSFLTQTVVTPIPEPSTWAAMLAGLAALGAMSRRRGHARR